MCIFQRRVVRKYIKVVKLAFEVSKEMTILINRIMPSSVMLNGMRHIWEAYLIKWGGGSLVFPTECNSKMFGLPYQSFTNSSIIQAKDIP